MFSFYEFFAGGGMARLGLGDDWTCLFSNDFDHKKSATYRKNWGDDVLKTADVREVCSTDLPDRANLIWASFPCQDLSLAGAGAGLKGERSGTFWPFWELVKELVAEDRAPEVIALENVCGTLTSHEGRDFSAICSAFERSGYRFGAMVVDAAMFVPQSRPRLFFLGVRNDVKIPESIAGNGSSSEWHTRSLREAYKILPREVRLNWIWWNMPVPPVRNAGLAQLIEENPACVEWHSEAETKQLLSMMSTINRNKVERAMRSGRRSVGTIYKRTRCDADGGKVQRAEIRFDDVAGCLRTPAGGSSRQLIMVLDGDTVRSRLISSRETARLMGLPDDYVLPENYNEAYHLTGDGVVVPVVRHIAKNIIEPLLVCSIRRSRAAA